jgi:hypothetical protein
MLPACGYGTVLVKQVDPVVNGEVGSPHQSIPARLPKLVGARTRSLALLVRGGYADKPEMIAAHSRR